MHRQDRASDNPLPTPEAREAPAAAEPERASVLQRPDSREELQLRDKLANLLSEIERLRNAGESWQKRYRTLLDAVPDAVTLLDDQDRIIDANREACERFGKSLPELRKLKVQDLNPDLPQHHIRQIWQTRALGDTFTTRVMNRHADGSQFPSEVHSKLFLDHGERRVIAVARDISESQAMLTELQASESRNRMLLEAMDKGVLIQDAKGHLTSANPAACRLLGLSEDEMMNLDRETFSAWR